MKRKVLYIALLVIINQIAFVHIFAVKAYPYPIVVNQPDGTQLTIRLHGDEFQHFQTTEDGYMLKKNKVGYYTYASTLATGEIVESNIIARNIKKRNNSDIQFLKTINISEQLTRFKSAPNRVKQLNSQNNPQKIFPSIGSPKSLVILVNFRDTSFVTPSPKSAFTNLLNQSNYSSNGGTGSARDYFMSSSYGKFSPTFDVVGPYTLPNNMAYYGSNETTDKFINTPKMIVDACNLANNAGMDFSQYDSDNDGYIDNVFVYFAGYNQAEGAPSTTIWPHRWVVTPSSNYIGTTASITFDGKILSDYACTSELRGNSGSNMCGIGTFCHEFSHLIGLADYYHTVDSYKSTLDEWSIMASGVYLNEGRTPPTYSTFDRSYEGWLTPQEINDPSDLFLEPIYQGKTQPVNANNQAFVLRGGTNQNEFFMLEYRKKTGWDSFLPDEGMLIWHIDFDDFAWASNTVNNYDGTTQTAESHMRVYLEPAASLTPPLTPGSPFPSDEITTFKPITWSGTDINKELKNITKTTDKISFKFMPLKIRVSGFLTEFTSLIGTSSASQNVSITTINLTSNLYISLQSGSNFDIKLSSENTWTKNLSIVPTSSQTTVNIEVRYNPLTIGTHSDQLLVTSTGFNAAIRVISGIANPVIITQVYGGGGNSGATYKSDFIELFNTTNSDVNISGWCIYYIAPTSSSTTLKCQFPSNTIIKAGKCFLLKCDEGTGTQPAWNIVADAICTLNMSSSSGKVVLLKSNSLFTLSTPPTIDEIINNVDFVDYVPFGTTAIPVWGSVMASNTADNTSARRKFINGKFQYTKNIGNDFEVVTAEPRNSSDITNTTTVNNSDITLFAYGKTISIIGATSNESIEIYNTTGLRVYCSKITSNSIQIKNLSTGIYIVRIGLNVFKITL